MFPCDAEVCLAGDGTTSTVLRASYAKDLDDIARCFPKKTIDEFIDTTHNRRINDRLYGHDTYA